MKWKFGGFITSLVPKGQTWAGLYPSEIESIKILGSNEPIKWKFTKKALVLTMPKAKPSNIAFVFRIALMRPILEKRS
jgi:hypothetical protein